MTPWFVFDSWQLPFSSLCPTSGKLSFKSVPSFEGAQSSNPSTVLLHQHQTENHDNLKPTSLLCSLKASLNQFRKFGWLSVENLKLLYLCSFAVSEILILDIKAVLDSNSSYLHWVSQGFFSKCRKENSWEILYKFIFLSPTPNTIDLKYLFWGKTSLNFNVNKVKNYCRNISLYKPISTLIYCPLIWLILLDRS